MAQRSKRSTTRRRFLKNSAGMGLLAFVGLSTTDALVSEVADRMGEKSLANRLANDLSTTPAARADEPGYGLPGYIDDGECGAA
ncbi:MAG: twin-arginine translocation signal domain-containing protein [Armatimonadia bacterium]|nr:twin-arginine translocation signal domain-containing protein [Armatimonadia bacterium]